ASVPLRSKKSSEVAKAFRKIYGNRNNPLTWPKLLQYDGVMNLWKCKHGHIWVASYRIKYDKTWCAKCGQDKTRLNISVPKEIAQNRNRKYISDTYISNRSPLIWECEKSHQWVQTLTNIRKGYWCLYCSGNALLSLEIAKQIVLSRHRQLKNKGQWCPTCAGYKKQSRIYADMLSHKMNVLIYKSWCPFCQKFKRKNLCREIVTKLLGSSSSKICKFNFLKTREYPTRLELDIPYYDLGFTIEVQEEQHWYRIKFFHLKPGDFEKQLERDYLKRDLCDENDIYLFYVWYDDEDPEKTIQDELWVLGLIN
ncbi:23453_t:CDS:2, partial [Racocetra persica]